MTSSAVPGSGGSLPNPLAGKAAWADYNNDGYVDLNLGSQLLRNTGNGTFSSFAVSHGQPIWGDYNNDGFVDLFDYSSGNLWRNNQGNSFSAVTTLAGMPPSSRGATWSDFNRDGYLDLYVGGYESFPDAYYADVIYTNNRNGTFTKTWTQGLDALTTPGRPRPARGVTSADWDQDGDLDVYVSNYRLEPNALWQNNGTGTFTDVAGAKNALATSPGYYGGHSIGAVWGDFNNDGLIDLFAGNFAHPGQPQSRFLKNRGPSAGYAFQDMGTGGVFYQESYASPTAGDIDNDGDLDLYFTTVYPTASFGVPNYPILFRNDGNFNFVDVTTAWGLPKSTSIFTSTYQAAFADYDNDGYLDLVTEAKLYRNTGGTNHYLKVRFDGDPLSDATVIGTQVRINLNGQTLIRQVEGAVGEGNQNDQSLHFGLGSYTGPLTLQVLWPNGAAQTLNVSGVNQTVTVRLPQPSLRINPYSGVVTIENTSTAAVALDGYQITSSSGRLVPDPTNTPGVGWDSLTDAERTGWQEVSPTVTALSELNLSSATSIAAGESLNLGRAFTPLGTRDVAWGYSMHGPSGMEVVANPGAIQYVGGMQVQVINLLGAGNVIEGTRVVLYNPESVSLNVDAYTVSSASGGLNPAGFSGLEGHGVAGWISVAVSANALSELNLTSSKVFAPGQGQVLGAPFATGGTHDLTLEWHLVGGGGAVETGTVVYVQRLAGDANGDGVVDIFDVNVVSSNWDTSSLNGDVNFDGLVNIFDINYVSSHWANTLGGGAAAVPEPASWVLLALCGCVGIAGLRRLDDRSTTFYGKHGAKRGLPAVNL